MLADWLFSLSPLFPPLNVFQYITFRSFLSFFTSFFVCFALGGLFISMGKGGLKEIISSDGPAAHALKKGTPTMGGSFILLGLLAVCLLWVKVSHPLVYGSLILVFGFAGIGLWDDWLKIKKGNLRGARRGLRLALEMLMCVITLSWLVSGGWLEPVIYVPVFKNISFAPGGFWYVLFASLTVTGAANGVNLTDGLDGLAALPVMVCSAALAALAYCAGHAGIASYLSIPFVPGAGEMAPLAAAVVAGALGFLWYNSHPAQVFMGDVGSLGLGAFLGISAVATKNELLLLLLGGVFVAETLSVIAQIVSFKLTGRRIFKMAPIHHHFELKGVAESKITTRFWIISILLAVLSLSLLKIR